MASPTRWYFLHLQIKQRAAPPFLNWDCSLPLRAAAAYLDEDPEEEVGQPAAASGLQE